MQLHLYKVQSHWPRNFQYKLNQSRVTREWRDLTCYARCDNKQSPDSRESAMAWFRHRAFTAPNSIPFGAISGTVKARLRFRNCTQMIFLRLSSVMTVALVRCINRTALLPFRTFRFTAPSSGVAGISPPPGVIPSDLALPGSPPPPPPPTFLKFLFLIYY